MRLPLPTIHHALLSLLAPLSSLPLLSLLPLPSSAALIVPGPFGPYDVAMKIQPLTDTSRRDPLDPSQTSPHRRLLTSFFLPVKRQQLPAQHQHDQHGQHGPQQRRTQRQRASGCSSQPITVPYMTDPVAAFYGQQAAQFNISANFYAQFQMQLCDLAGCTGNTDKPRQQDFPVILFDPGLAESRLIYNAMARSLASQGYIVVTVDHPFEAPAVEFPDGTVIQGIDIDDSDLSVLKNILSIRTADISFVIDQLFNSTLTDPLMADFPGTPNLSHLAIWGHSFGGATSASVLHSDASTHNRLRGGLDLDGMLIDPIMSTDIRKPFILAGQLDHAKEDPSWDLFWPHLRAQRMQIGINHTMHGAFKDILLLLSAVGEASVPRAAREAIQEVLGTIDPYQLDRGLNGILTAFFDLVFYASKDELLHLPERFANVSIVREDL